MPRSVWRQDGDLVEREEKLRAEAGAVMKALQDRGEGWELAWKEHPVANAYRALLREAWARKSDRRHVEEARQ